MSTMQAEYRTDIARLAEDMAKRDAEGAKRETDAVKRDKQQLLAIAGLIAIATTILGILIGLPG